MTSMCIPFMIFMESNKMSLFANRMENLCSCLNLKKEKLNILTWTMVVRGMKCPRQLFHLQLSSRSLTPPSDLLGWCPYVDVKAPGSVLYTTRLK